MAPATEGAQAGRRADRRGGDGWPKARRAPARGCLACGGGRRRGAVRARRAALRARPGRPRAAARVLRAPAQRAPGGQRGGPGRAWPGRVAARGGDPHGTAPPQAERRARRPRLRARRGPGAHLRMKLYRWDVPGPYDVAFTTRRGGVSDGPYESLNLGLMTGDDPDRVQKKRARVCVDLSADPVTVSV